MLRVSIELIPHGIEDHPRRRVLNVIDIFNDGSAEDRQGDDSTTGNYGARIYAKGSTTRVVRTTSVTGFPRLRKNAVHLLARVLKNAGYV